MLFLRGEGGEVALGKNISCKHTCHKKIYLRTFSEPAEKHVMWRKKYHAHRRPEKKKIPSE